MRFHFRYGASWSSVIAVNAEKAIEYITTNVANVNLIQFRSKTIWEKQDEKQVPATSADLPFCKQPKPRKLVRISHVSRIV